MPMLSANRGLKDYLKFIGPGTVITIVGFIIAYQFVAPAPPRHIRMATGSSDGAYYHFGRSYSGILSEYGVRLELIKTAGSVDNLKLLGKNESKVDVAFVQGGIQLADQSPGLNSLGSLYYEPLWVFHRQGISINRLSDIRGRRIDVGREGSGTKVLVMQLLTLNGVSEQNTVIISQGGKKAADLLLAGELDAAFFVTAHHSPVIREVLYSEKIQLMNWHRAAAYAARLHYLSVLKLPASAIDFVENIPSANTTLLAPTSQLVARTEFHAALIDLILQAATETHQAGGLFEKTGEFPAPKYLDFKLNKEARRFYKSGPPFLRRFLPFWVASFIDRTKVMLVPLVALFFPLFKIMPLVYRWRFRSKIYRWYRKLAQVDPELRKDVMTPQLEKYLSRLDRIEAQVCQTTVPLSFSNELYHLRLHIDMLRNKLVKTSREIQS